MSNSNMSAPSGTETQPHGYTISKTRKRAVKFLQFFAQWAEDVQEWETPAMLECLDLMEETFIQSEQANHQKTRVEALFYLDLMRRLVKKLNKQHPATIQYLHDEIDALDFKIDVQ